VSNVLGQVVRTYVPPIDAGSNLLAELVAERFGPTSRARRTQPGAPRDREVPTLHAAIAERRRVLDEALHGRHLAAVQDVA
jgi:hypothetical protein